MLDKNLNAAANFGKSNKSGNKIPAQEILGEN